MYRVQTSKKKKKDRNPDQTIEIMLMLNSDYIEIEENPFPVTCCATQGRLKYSSNFFLIICVPKITILLLK